MTFDEFFFQNLLKDNYLSIFTVKKAIPYNLDYKYVLIFRISNERNWNMTTRLSCRMHTYVLITLKCTYFWGVLAFRGYL